MPAKIPETDLFQNAQLKALDSLKIMEQMLGTFGWKLKYDKVHTIEKSENKKLRLNIESLTSPKEVERIATEKLNLVVPSQDQVIVLERFEVAPPPDAAIVATRR